MPAKIVMRNALSGFNPGLKPYFDDGDGTSTEFLAGGRPSVLLAHSSTAATATGSTSTGATTTSSTSAYNASSAIPRWTPGQGSLQNWSAWACLALGVIMVVVVIVVGYAVYSCYRSSAVVATRGRVAGGNEDIDEGERARKMDNDARTRTRMRNAGTRLGADADDKVKRRGIAVFCEKAKLLGRFKDLTSSVSVSGLEGNGADWVILPPQAQTQTPSSYIVASHQGRDGKKEEQEKKTPPRRWHVTNTHTHANTSPSSTSGGDSPVSLSGYPYSLSYEGNSCSSSPGTTLATPPPAYFRLAHRESPIRRGHDSRRPTSSPTPSPNSKRFVHTGIPVTPPGGSGDGELFDSHNIRFVVRREKSMERLWKDPKLSPVGGSIIYPRPGGLDSPKPGGGAAAPVEKKGRSGSWR